MQLKHVLIFCLSVLLLCVPASASVCELSCSLSHVYPVHKPTGGASAKQAHQIGTSETIAPHSHCGHASTARPVGPADQGIENSDKCTNALCAQAQTLSQVNRLDGAKPGSVYFAVLASVPTVVSNFVFGTAKHEFALAKLVPLDPLSVSLRI
jgi:hypothetical protein